MKLIPGQVFRKRAFAGFVGEPLTCRIPTNADLDHERGPCMAECGDPGCIEWANVEVLEEGEPVGWVYHISECEAEPL